MQQCVQPHQHQHGGGRRERHWFLLYLAIRASFGVHLVLIKEYRHLLCVSVQYTRNSHFEQRCLSLLMNQSSSRSKGVISNGLLDYFNHTPLAGKQL